MGSGEGTTAFGKSTGSGSERTRVPKYLRDFVLQGRDTASGALGRLNQLSNQNLVAGFDPATERAHDMALARAGGADDFFPTAFDTLIGAAKGTDISEFLPQDVIANLMGGTDRLDQGAVEALRGAGGDVRGTDVLSSLSGSSQLDPAAIEGLRRTAGGDFLFGGEGFNAAVDAAVRAARPQILSTFGPNRATGGLSEVAIGKAGIDAFASQYGQERSRQEAANRALAELGLADAGLRGDIAGNLSGIDLARGNQELSAATTLANLSDTRGGAGILADIANQERSRQLTSADLLPGLAREDINLISDVGAERQGLEQARINAPIQAQQQLLMAALGGLPIESLLGRDSKFKGFDFGQSFTARGGGKGGGSGGSGGKN